VVFSLWHVPAFYDAMMRNHDLHIVMHLMVMGSAVLMWWPVAGRSRSPAMQASASHA